MELDAAFVRPSPTSTAAFVAVVMAVWVMLVGFTGWAARRGGRSAGRITVTFLVGLALWAGLTGAAMATGWMVRLHPASVVAFVASSQLLALGLAFSPVGTLWAHHLPVGALIGFHAFRLPLELILHAWYESGTLPVQMTWSGLNFDVVTGALALAIAVTSIVARIPTWGVWLFTVVGMTLLLTVVSIALTSAPLPIRLFTNHPPVLLPYHFPYGWIVSFAVAPALFAHVVLLRRLARGSRP